MRRESTPLAVTFSLIAACLYVCFTYLVQKIEGRLSEGAVVFFGQLFALALLLPLIPLKLGSYGQLKTTVFPLHAFRTFASLASMFSLYFSLRFLPLSDTILLSYTRPLFIPIIVFFWFGIRWTKEVYIGLSLGFLGIVVAFQPKLTPFNFASLMALSSAFFGAIAFTTIRRLTRTEPSERITFYYMFLSLPFAFIPLVRRWVFPTPREWVLLFAIGAVSLIYQLCLSRAYRHATASKIGCLLYSSAAFAYLFDYALGKKTLSISVFTGIALIVIGSLFSLKEQKKR